MTRPNSLPPPPLPSLSEAQLEVMDVVWNRGGATVGEIWQALAPRRKVARNTIQTLVTRLEEKGWLTHGGNGGVFRYHATRPREMTQRGLLRRLLASAFGGSREGLLMALLDDDDLSREEVRQIRALIDRAEDARR